MRQLLLALACFIAGGAAAFFIRRSMNPYVGSLAVGQVWLVSILCGIAGIIAALKTSWRPWGLTLILMGVSLVIGLATVSAFVPSQALPVQPLVTGSFVRIQLREGTTAQQQDEFLCEYVYSRCTASGNTFRPEVNSLTRTKPNELTIGTTPEFQERLLEQVKRSPIVESAQAGSA
jgi:hypothetical protein